MRNKLKTHLPFTNFPSIVLSTSYPIKSIRHSKISLQRKDHIKAIPWKFSVFVMFGVIFVFNYFVAGMVG